ncbi:DUF5344 family protein [Halalkalibacterium halodurans]|uniref:BH2345 protein n=1 Tax=Halalkalibacterium halodurans (strain ATCC BAA-125 / DSM 18197 / FERM 7344 / JCM 9153 / C-125) TaxID=272558 RepID=Q9KAE4_HALH5|nr:DUF5344 family protein [Halalkalibacterium halodurans]MDY7222893.1 DUF5344 family protein [Halalkalibacterium halodurans]MDY7242114.1 DUF5344 family protein [Halalkalibacterium halodurans]MED4081173.1 DUF5344 family protein [Halalkalibacterium halodurans]MED4087008.1 DUF5344 family protein [Halalkalibacterium halodurans]MED4103174.1 DUF5344 family protein [Halalkalibacterium halodurans]
MEIKVNVAEVTALLRSVGEVSASFNTQPIERARDLDMIAVFCDVKNELDDDLMAYMRATSDMQKQLQSQIQTYDKVDRELAAKMGSQ